MTPLKPIENLFAVEVPNEISDPHFYRVNENAIMLKWNDVKHPLNPHDIKRVDRFYGDLKEYKWPEILLQTINATEQQAAGVVESHLYPFDNTIMGFEDYRHYGYASCETAKESLQSLLRFNGLDASKNYLLIKKTT